MNMFGHFSKSYLKILKAKLISQKLVNLERFERKKLLKTCVILCYGNS